ncbi:MAG: hypothetical protein HDT19_03770 [Oscillibacter sp.]|nr:hypothetical protein [Oscillibacter sp.]
MGLFDRWKKREPPPTSGGAYLEFDSFPFKLAVAQVLMYDLGLLGEPYRGGDEYMKRYEPDLETVSGEVSIQRLLPHIEEAEAYFRALNIPAALADRVEKLYVGEELEIYYQINPQWGDFDEYFEDGKAFDITAVTEREIKQFPHLKQFVFNMFHDPPEELIQQLNQWGICTDCD